MKIAIVRGSNLNKFEMQTYEALSKHFGITAFCLKGNNFDLKDIKLPVSQLWGLDSFVPRFVRRYYYFTFGFIFEINQPMFGLNKRLKGIDIVHCPDMHYYYTYQVAKHKSKYGYKLVLTIAENVPFAFGGNWLSRKRIKEIIPEVDMFLPLTQRAAEALTLQGITTDRIKIIPFGVDTTLFYPRDERDETYYRKFDISIKDLVVLYIGRLSKWKGLFELVYAAKKILEDKELKGENIKFLLVGAGPKRKKIEALLDYLKIADGFRMVGSVDYSQIPRIHNMADIFVLPSIVSPKGQEQFGMVLIESMACGKPVIGSLTGSIPEVVGEAGLLVQPSDHYSLYQALKKLILEKSLRVKLGELARKRVMANFDSKVVAQKIKEIYQSL
jgi:glycosyltransferase involved in cell wall biosynthesis